MQKVNFDGDIIAIYEDSNKLVINDKDLGNISVFLASKSDITRFQTGQHIKGPAEAVLPKSGNLYLKAEARAISIMSKSVIPNKNKDIAIGHAINNAVQLVCTFNEYIKRNQLDQGILKVSIKEYARMILEVSEELRGEV
jgi:hypothetical protein